MLIVKITKQGKAKYYGAVSVEVEKLGDGQRRVKMRSTCGIKRIGDLSEMDSVIVLNDMVEL